MARGQPIPILDPLRRLVNRQTGSSLTDTQLLENFVARRDEASFEVLVWRHGAMVLDLCRRILRDAHEAEDAFQAAFLIFARKAHSIGRGESVVCWLYKVAYRIALRLRTRAAKRATAGEPEAVPARVPPDGDWADLRPVLDDEIARLPEKYRAPFVLCYLEGRTNEEAAAQLGCPKGTVLSRLSRGRERLRERLARRGVALGSAALALALANNAAKAAVPTALVPCTVGAAIQFAAGTAASEVASPPVATLVNGALHAMTVFKLKVAASALVALAILGTGIAWAARDGDVPARGPDATGPVAFVAPAGDPNADAQDRQPDRQRPAPPALVGAVLEVAKDGKSFTVATPPTERGGEPGKATVKFADNSTVTYQGVGLGGATPTAGYQVQVWFEGTSKEVAATVQFTGPQIPRGGDVNGQVVEIAKDGKSVTLELLPVRGERPIRGAEPKRVEIAFDIKTIVGFSNVGPDGTKIEVGQRANVWYADDGKTAGKVVFSGTAGDSGRRDATPPAFAGKVVAVGRNGTSITVEVPATVRGEEPTRIQKKLSDKTAIVFHNVETGAAKPAEGQHAIVYAEGANEAATKVILTGTLPERWTTVTGKVVAVAKDGKSFTVEIPPTMRGQDPKRTEVKLTDKTKVIFYGVGPGEAKVAEGLMAQVRLLDDSTDTAGQATFGKPGERGR